MYYLTMKKLLIIDAQGGGLGKQLILAIKAEFPEQEIIAVGTNSAATTNMLKAGANFAATGENAVIVNSKKADIILGPIGIVIADSMLGEITPKMAIAVCQSPAERILIPFNHCDNILIGISDWNTGKFISETINALKAKLTK